jgi:hypothetical protein
VAYGWVAAGEASIGELTISFGMAAQDRYLWDFQTLPQWRGLRIYPRLLQGIMRHAALEDGRFWIINAPENVASAKGIGKAGFRVVGAAVDGARCKRRVIAKLRSAGRRDLQ